MIKNEKQYKTTKAQQDKFLKSIELIQSTKEDGLLKDLMINQLKSQIESFEEEIFEYEKLKNEKPAIISSSIEDLPEALIKVRISKGFSQSQLAKKVGLKEQQIQRYESCNYETASFSRIIQIAKSMGVYFDQSKLFLRSEELHVDGFDPTFLKQLTTKMQARKSLLAI